MEAHSHASNVPIPSSFPCTPDREIGLLSVQVYVDLQCRCIRLTILTSCALKMRWWINLYAPSPQSGTCHQKQTGSLYRRVCDCNADEEWIPKQTRICVYSYMCVYAYMQITEIAETHEPHDIQMIVAAVSSQTETQKRRKGTEFLSSLNI